MKYKNITFKSISNIYFPLYIFPFLHYFSHQFAVMCDGFERRQFEMGEHSRDTFII